MVDRVHRKGRVTTRYNRQELVGKLGYQGKEKIQHSPQYSTNGIGVEVPMIEIPMVVDLTNHLGVHQLGQGPLTNLNCKR